MDFLQFLGSGTGNCKVKIDTLATFLRDFDRLSMGHGVEVRTPFLDWRLVCYCFSLPSKSKMGGGLKIFFH
jgi:asparagine synthetase B (glutamine-hydrolysing)